MLEAWLWVKGMMESEYNLMSSQLLISTEKSKIRCMINQTSTSGASFIQNLIRKQLSNSWRLYKNVVSNLSMMPRSQENFRLKVLASKIGKDVLETILIPRFKL